MRKNTASPPENYYNTSQGWSATALAERCAELARRGGTDAAYWAEVGCLVTQGCWPEEMRERWAIQHEDDPLPAWAAQLIGRHMR